MKQVTLSLPEEIVHLLGLKEKDLEREFLIRFAVTLYAEGKISLGKAAEITGLAYADIMERLAEFGLGSLPNAEKEFCINHWQVEVRTRKGGKN